MKFLLLISLILVVFKATTAADVPAVLPQPNQKIQDTVEEKESDIKSLISNNENSSNETQNSTSQNSNFENSILEKIKKN